MSESIDSPFVAQISPAISEAEAYAELRTLIPHSDVRIERLANGRVRIWQNHTKLTVRPTLQEAVGRVRWYFKTHKVIAATQSTPTAEGGG